MKGFFNFFLANHELYGIIALILLVLFLIILRIIKLKKIPKDKVSINQAPEFRDKFILTRDQYQLKIYQQINQKSNVIIVGIHDLQGQKDDFKFLSNLCYQEQWSLIAYDRRGVGKNLTDWKFQSLNTDINDTKDVVKAIKTKYPNHKIILFGEAIGACIASSACQDNQQVDGLIISNLITKNNLYPFSLLLFFKVIIAFFFNRNVKLPIYIEPEDISNNNAYITNMKQRYTLKQVWSLNFLWQFKQLNKKTPKIIRNLTQPTLILQSGDDVFSDFHQLRVLNKKWKPHQKYHFIFTGKHALINEPEIKDIFKTEIQPWVVNVV
ncbi:MAG: alpha/beta hydrolase [Spiroplasma sp.]|nr:alpha/beta hydrolase [Spiroplasma sp.]